MTLTLALLQSVLKAISETKSCMIVVPMQHWLVMCAESSLPQPVKVPTPNSMSTRSSHDILFHVHQSLCLDNISLLDSIATPAETIANV